MDFQNVDTIKQTYSGAERQVIDILREELDKADYVKEIDEPSYDPKELLDPNFQSYKYVWSALLWFIIISFVLTYLCFENLLINILHQLELSLIVLILLFNRYTRGQLIQWVHGK